MRHFKQTKAAVILLLFSLVVAVGGIVLIAGHRDDRQKSNTDEYIEQKMVLDSQLSKLKSELRAIDTSVKGTVVWMFDQCQTNVYDVAYKQMSEFNFSGSVVFRDVLPGMEGMITTAQWSEMQSAGWTPVLASGDALLEKMGSDGYAEAVIAYVKDMNRQLAELGFREARAYAFAEDECTDELMFELSKIGIEYYTAPNVETRPAGEHGLLLRTEYMCSDPSAVTVQSALNAVRNKVDGVVLTTRFVMDGGELSLDCTPIQFRTKMLSLLFSYRGDGTVAVATVETAAASYLGERSIYNSSVQKRADLQAKIEEVEQEIEELWRKYR